MHSRRWKKREIKPLIGKAAERAIWKQNEQIATHEKWIRVTPNQLKTLQKLDEGIKYFEQRIAGERTSDPQEAGEDKAELDKLIVERNKLLTKLRARKIR